MNAKYVMNIHLGTPLRRFNYSGRPRVFDYLGYFMNNNENQLYCGGKVYYIVHGVQTKNKKITTKNYNNKK